MHPYNRQRSRLTMSPKEKFLLGPQFMLHASSTAVQERPQLKKDSLTPKSGESTFLQTGATRTRPVSYVESTGMPATEQLINLMPRQGSTGSSSRRAYRVSTTTAQDFGTRGAFMGAGDADYHSMIGSSHGRTLSSYLPGDKVVFSDKSPVTGVPVAYRTTEEKANNPDRLNLDRHQLTCCPQLDGEDQLRLLNYQHNMIRKIECLESLTRLIFLDFYDNQIDCISGLNSLRSLRVLMLGKNRIKVIENLEVLTKLDVLDLHGNQIKEIKNLGHLSDLRVLNLAGNQIEHVRNLTGLNLLTELNLRRNKIRTVTEIDFLPNIQRLFLSFNEINCFDDISCITESSSLSELALDNNPIAQELNYKSVILSHAQQLKQLDMKRISEDERRVAVAMGRREEEKKRENSKMAMLVEKRKRTINNARQQWEQMVNSRNVLHSKRKTMPDLYATHVATIPNSGEVVAERSYDDVNDYDGIQSESSSPKSNHSEKYRTVTTNDSIRPKSSGPVLRTSHCQDNSFQANENRSTGDHLSEIEGDTLNLFGSGSLDAFEKSWGLQAAGAVTTVCFHFIDFDEIVKVLSKIRIRFPNINTLTFRSTNIRSLQQLNALSAIRRLDNLVIEPDGNPVTNLALWRPYVIFRLAHFNLKKVNGKEVGVSDIVGAEKYFATLASTIANSLPHARLISLLGDKKKQLLLEDKVKKTDPLKAMAAEKTEPVGRAVLGYTGTMDGSPYKSQDIKKHNFLRSFLQSMSSSASQSEQKISVISANWNELLSSFVRSTIIEMWDGPSYMRKCMEEHEKLKASNHKEREFYSNITLQPEFSN